MRKLLFIPLLLLLVTPCHAQDMLARMNPYILGAGVGVSETPTWYYSDVSQASTATDDDGIHAIGAPVVVSAGTTLTKIAFKVVDNLSATTCKVALYDTQATSSLIASGTCTPTDTSWCVATVTGTVSAATYRVIHMCDTKTTHQYSDTNPDIGIYKLNVTYADFPASTQSWDATNYLRNWWVAVCVGGTCSSGPTP